MFLRIGGAVATTPHYPLFHKGAHPHFIFRWTKRFRLNLIATKYSSSLELRITVTYRLVRVTHTDQPLVLKLQRGHANNNRIDYESVSKWFKVEAVSRLVMLEGRGCISSC